MNWKLFWGKDYPTVVILAFTLGLTGAFIWKMIYHPEPLIPVMLELMIIYTLASTAIWQIRRN